MTSVDNNNACACQGMGWIFVDNKCQACKEHFCGQLHPNSKSLLLDDMPALREEERKSRLRWRIAQERNTLAALLIKVKGSKLKIDTLETELYTATPTTKMKKPSFDRLMLDLQRLEI